MRRSPKDVPDSVRACLWFADINYLDWKKQQDLVVTQVLNRGTWEAVRWVYRTYGTKAMKASLLKPKRGFWFPQSLVFWSKFFGIKLSRETFEMALLRLDPASAR